MFTNQMSNVYTELPSLDSDLSKDFDKSQTIEKQLANDSKIISVKKIKHRVNMINLMTTHKYNNSQPVKGIWYEDNQFTIWCMKDDKFMFTTTSMLLSPNVNEIYSNYMGYPDPDSLKEIIDYPGTVCWSLSDYQSIVNKLKNYEKSKNNLISAKNTYNTIYGVGIEADHATRLAYTNLIKTVRAFKYAKNCNSLKDKQKYFDTFVRANKIYLKMSSSLDKLSESFVTAKINMVYYGKIWINDAKILCN